MLGRDLKKTIIVDNIKENFERQEANGIEIVTWMDDPNDNELNSLGNFLRGVVESEVQDVRPMVGILKAQCWQSPKREKRTRDIYAGDNVSPRGCTPHTDKKGAIFGSKKAESEDARLLR